MPFSVASYNILADAYITPTRYPGIPATVLAPERRRPALLQHIQNLAADVICLQEVEPHVLRTIADHLQPCGYVAYYAQKKGRKPDGCATLVKCTAVAVRAIHTLHFHDGGGTQPDSGHVALVLLLDVESRVAGIINTHLKWGPPGKPRHEQWGYRQATELLEYRSLIAPACQAWVLCGDFNTTPDSNIISVLKRAGLEDAYRGREQMYTCNSHQKAKRIDYLLHTNALTSHPVDLPGITDHTPLPSEQEPSDHLAIMAGFAWAAQAAW
jgi:mRNA deadenylase 3'-5' endonuclease subunit Ccr4